MTDSIQELIEQRGIEDHTCSYDDNYASLHLDDIGIFDGVDLCDYDEELNPTTIVSANSSNTSDQDSVKPRGHRRDDDDDSAGFLLSMVPPEVAYPAPGGADSWLTTVSDDVEASPNPEAEKATMASGPPPVRLSPTDDNKLVNATFRPDSRPRLTYPYSSWRYDNPGGTFEEGDAVLPPPPLNRRVTPPGMVSKKRSVAPRPIPRPLVQGVVAPSPKIRELKTKHYVSKTPADVLLGRGGCSNHHSGNSGYRKRILKLQPVYKRLERQEKTQFSQDTVNWVKNRGGRFLKRDAKTSPWYIATDQMARRKVSQALREDHSAAGIKAKKEKRAKAAKRSERRKS